MARLSWRALRRLGVPEDALPDAVQDVLLVAHRRGESFRGDSSLSTWVFGIVIRVASNHRRRRRRAEAVFAPDAGEAIAESPSREPSPLAHLEQREASHLMHSLLDTLTPELQEVFVLVELEGLSLPAASESLGVRETTCKSRLRTARRLFNAAVSRAAALRKSEGQ